MSDFRSLMSDFLSNFFLCDFSSDLFVQFFVLFLLSDFLSDFWSIFLAIFLSNFLSDFFRPISCPTVRCLMSYLRCLLGSMFHVACPMFDFLSDLLPIFSDF